MVRSSAQTFDLLGAVESNDTIVSFIFSSFNVICMMSHPVRTRFFFFFFALPRRRPKQADMPP